MTPSAEEILAHLESYAAELRKQEREYREYGQPANAHERDLMAHGLERAIKSARTKFGPDLSRTEQEREWILEGEDHERRQAEIKRSAELWKRFHGAACYNPIKVGTAGLTREELEGLADHHHAYRVERHGETWYGVVYNGG